MNGDTMFIIFEPFIPTFAIWGIYPKRSNISKITNIKREHKSSRTIGGEITHFKQQNIKSEKKIYIYK